VSHHARTIIGIICLCSEGYYCLSNFTGKRGKPVKANIDKGKRRKYHVEIIGEFPSVKSGESNVPHLCDGGSPYISPNKKDNLSK